MASYGADKLNDPAKAEPVVQRMIQLEPGEPTNYFALAKIYEDAGAYDEAEKMLVQAKTAKPSDPAVYMTLAGYYNRQGHFDKTIEALEERAAKEPNNPEAFYTIATYYWDEAYRDFKLKDNEKKDFVAKGIEAIDHALQLKPDYIEAIVYKGLLLRLQANLEKDPAKQQQLLKDATALSEKANAMRKAKTAGRRLNARKCREIDPPTDWIERPSGHPDGLLFCTDVTTLAVKSSRSFEPQSISEAMAAAHDGPPWRTHESHYLLSISDSSCLLRPAVAGRPRGRAGRHHRRDQRRRQGRAGRRHSGRHRARRAPAVGQHLRGGDAGRRTIRHARHARRRTVHR